MAYHRQPLDVLALPTWQALQQHRQAMQRFSMRDAFAGNPKRFEQFSLSSCGLFLDYSKNLASDETMALLMALAREVGLEQSIRAMFDGCLLYTSPSPRDS